MDTTGGGKKKGDDLDDMMDTLSLSRKSVASRKSQARRALEGEESDGEEGGADDKRSSFSYKAGGTGIHRRLKAGEKKVSEYGSEYKAKVSRFRTRGFVQCLYKIRGLFWEGPEAELGSHLNLE